MRIKIEIELRRPSRRVIALLLGVVLLAVPGAVLASHQFPDVTNGNPFHDDIEWMADNNIANGFSDGTYRPGQAVTRQAMAAFMHRLSNQFQWVSKTIDPVGGAQFFGEAPCPAGKRPIAGGGIIQAPNAFVSQSYPSGNGWAVIWKTDGNASIDPPSLVVYSLCAPGL